MPDVIPWLKIHQEPDFRPQTIMVSLLSGVKME